MMKKDKKIKVKSYVSNSPDAQRWAEIDKLEQSLNKKKKKPPF